MLRQPLPPATEALSPHSRGSPFPALLVIPAPSVPPAHSSSPPHLARHPLPASPPAAGVPARPNTPVGNLISHGFRYDWVMQSDLAEDLAASKKMHKPSPTRSSQVLTVANAERRAKSHEYPPALPPTSKWKMAKFKNVKSKICIS